MPINRHPNGIILPSAASISTLPASHVGWDPSAGECGAPEPVGDAPGGGGRHCPRTEQQPAGRHRRRGRPGVLAGAFLLNPEALEGHANPNTYRAFQV